jgi:hypothetical protein
MLSVINGRKEGFPMVRRGKQSRPSPEADAKASLDKAAKAGEKEVNAEKRGDLPAARRAGREEEREQEKATKSQSRKGNGGSRGRSNVRGATTERAGRKVLTDMVMPDRYVTAPVILKKRYTGGTSETDIFFDRDFVTKPSVISVAYSAVQWGMNNLNAVVPDPLVLPMRNLINNLYNDIASEYQSRNGRTIRDTLLDNTVVAGSPLSQELWLNIYSSLFMLVRGLESMMAAGNINYTTSLMANVVMQFKPQLVGLKRRLEAVHVPADFVKLLDRLCGVKYIDDDIPVMVYFYGAVGPTVPDLSNTGDVANLILLGNALASALIVAGNAAQVNDFQRIANTFALAYNNQHLAAMGDKGVSQSLGEYDLFYNSMGSYLQTAPLEAWSSPVNNPASGQQVIPTFIRKGATEDDSMLLQSLFPGFRYTTDAQPMLSATGVPSFTGLLATSNLKGTPFTGGTQYGYYNQQGTFLIINQSGAAPAATTYLNTELEVMQSLPYARIALPNNWFADRRQYREFDILKPTVRHLIDATLYETERIFIESVIG